MSLFERDNHRFDTVGYVDLIKIITTAHRPGIIAHCTTLQPTLPLIDPQLRPPQLLLFPPKYNTSPMPATHPSCPQRARGIPGHHDGARIIHADCGQAAFAFFAPLSLLQGLLQQVSSEHPPSALMFGADTLLCQTWVLQAQHYLCACTESHKGYVNTELRECWGGPCIFMKLLSWGLTRLRMPCCKEQQTNTRVL